MPRLSQNAFTLIELLVVVAIMVLLLSLLTPAIEKAIYSAELAQCGARQDMVISTVVLYAMEFKRTYPRGALPRDGGYQPDLIGWRTNDQHIQRDIRPTLYGRLGLDQLLCPLTEEIDISLEANDANTQVFSNYAIYFGWKYDGQQGMYKVGDTLGAYDSTTDRSYTFKVLLSDKNIEHIAGSSQTSHPDRSGRNRVERYQNEHTAPSVAVFDIEYGGPQITQSKYASGPGAAGRRGLLDLNFGMADGSVLRVDAIEIFDDRLKPAPAHANDGNPAWDAKLPL